MSNEDILNRISGRPDLEEIEAGSSGNRWVSVLLAVVALLFALFILPFTIILLVVVVFLGVMDQSSNNSLGVRIFLIVFAAIGVHFNIWALRKVICTEDCWKTDAEGLTVYRTFTKRRLLWKNVRKASVVSSRFGGAYYRFETIQGTLSISSKAMEYVSLEESIRYHLKRHSVLVDDSLADTGQGRLNVNDPMYIPELETVEAHGHNEEVSGVFSVVFAGLLAVMGTGLVLRLWELFSRSTLGNIAFAVLATLLVLVYLSIIKSLFWRDQYIRSDASGLTIKRALRKQFIPWADVEDAWVGKDTNDEPQLTLKYKGRIFAMSSDAAIHLGLSASIWQHLRQHGKADNVRISDSVRSLWSYIPDSVPREMDWTPKATDEGVEPGTVELREDRISGVGGYAPVTIRFSEVTLAGWARGQEQAFLFINNTRKRKGIVVPVDFDDPDCVRLLFAIIRRLRTAGMPQWLEIPQELLSALEK